MSAMSASILAQMATTGAFCVAAYSFRRSRKGLFSKPVSLTLPTNMAGLAVIRHSGLRMTSSSFDKSIVRTGWPSLSTACTLVSTATSLAASLSLPDLAALMLRCRVLSTVPRSARQSSVWITSMSEIGSTLPAT
ncbi:MAG: hypothetical protein BWX79_01356 [Alphaproteobacteria bacterium ADurb.Bin100]|nr:MAG: hypothetical protein BWX79_01356 [Alphaproteobacteria bacterium ADurb.Bin100]